MPKFETLHWLCLQLQAADQTAREANLKLRVAEARREARSKR